MSARTTGRLVFFVAPRHSSEDATSASNQVHLGRKVGEEEVISVTETTIVEMYSAHAAPVLWFQMRSS